MLTLSIVLRVLLMQPNVKPERELQIFQKLQVNLINNTDKHTNSHVVVNDSIQIKYIMCFYATEHPSNVEQLPLQFTPTHNFVLTKVLL